MEKDYIQSCIDTVKEIKSRYQEYIILYIYIDIFSMFFLINVIDTIEAPPARKIYPPQY